MFLYSFICAPLLLSLDCQYFVHYKSLVFFYLSSELSWCSVSFLKGDLQFSKFLKNTISIGLCKLKYTEKRFIPFTPLQFLPEFVPHTEFKGRPEDAKWNVLNHTSFRNYAPFSLQVPSILSILVGYTSTASLVTPTLESWPNTEAHLASWRRANQPGEICFVMDGPWPSLTEFTVCTCLELSSCELLANPAAVADVLVLNAYKTPS